jgi:hypothetical protein
MGSEAVTGSRPPRSLPKSLIDPSRSLLKCRPPPYGFDELAGRQIVALFEQRRGDPEGLDGEPACIPYQIAATTSATKSPS